jgi:DNA-binding transcriptional MocR family regulator
MQIPLLLDPSRSETPTMQLIEQLPEAIRRGGERPTTDARCDARAAATSGSIPAGRDRRTTRQHLVRFLAVSPGGFAVSTEDLARLLQGALSRGGASGLSQVGDPGGLAGLRAALSHHLATARGIVADPVQVLVLSGIREGISLASRLLLAPGRKVAVENLAYRGAVGVFAMAGAEILPVPVDEDGIRNDLLPERAMTILYVTPSHQYPTGHILSLARRQAIADWARRQGCYILEDDYDGDFCFEGPPLPAIAALAPECTIYLGSFTKSLGAGGCGSATWSRRHLSQKRCGRPNSYSPGLRPGSSRRCSPK